MNTPHQPHQPQVAELLEKLAARLDADHTYARSVEDGSEFQSLATEVRSILASALRANPAPDFSELEAVVRSIRAGYGFPSTWADRIEAFIRGSK